MALRATLISSENSLMRALPQQRKVRGGLLGYRLRRSDLAANGLDAKRGTETASSCELRFLSDPAFVPVARRAAARCASALSAFDGEALMDIELAVGEALANAVEHGHRDGSYVSLRCESRDDAFQVTVSDGGTGFDPCACLAAEPYADRGYGIGIMRRAMDRVEFLGGGTTVKMLKRFITAPRAPRGAKA